MSQEIKFRAKFIEDLKWCYFSLNDIARLGDAFLNYSGWSQYTNLTDKNGQEIYERDVVSWTPYVIGSELDTSRNRYICKVEWSNGAWRVSEGNYKAVMGTFRNIEIIGNVVDHPELLEAT